MPDRYQLQYPADQESIRTIEKASDSFLLDKIKDLIFNKIIRFTTFFTESIGTSVAQVGYTINRTGTGDVINDQGLQLALQTGTGSGGRISVEKNLDVNDFLTFLAPSQFRSSFRLTDVTAVQTYIVAGQFNNDIYYGFKVLNTALCGVVNNASHESVTEQTILLKTTGFSGVTANAQVDIASKFFPGQRCVFYVNGLEAGQINAGNPSVIPNNATSSGSETGLFGLDIKTNENATKTMNISYFDIIQDRLNPSQ